MIADIPGQHRMHLQEAPKMVVMRAPQVLEHSTTRWDDLPNPEVRKTAEKNY